ncbi:tRNA-specific adenosine deaminase [Mycolicibacterium sp. TY66]|jgi:guanine deaminase|uniref:nucleoside deaminase n=1 Tax=Mycobacteriaceae TaxID=1762 RepID=UPI000FAD2952|nr:MULTISPECIES: nucleoside deaminase [unclassified Mycolicibacterium]RUP30470.1 MAG: nucleoside deaminase [Mycolicibacterium sp.]BCI82408.1 tRNA-specific adenosine deaminase [Mycolicibacterium sp. TY66]BCJ79945.1 tRNA-specific adenosine deaminase [Mycolicibacterium sp. TY81]
MNAFTGTDPKWLGVAIDLATANVEAGGGPFGAVVVGAGELVSTGQNRVTQNLDPTAHAEVMAIRAACERVGNFSLAGHTLYSSCEPCPLCLSAALWARVDRIVFAADRHDAAVGGFDDRAFYELFDKPRAHWEVPVQQHRLDRSFLPFETWIGNSARVQY